MTFLALSEFRSPLYFWVGAALTLLLIFLPVFKKRRGLAIDLQYWKGRIAFQSKRVPVLSCLLVSVAILLAAMLADPQFTTKSAQVVHGKPVMIVVDVSGSMGYTGVPGKEKVSSFEQALQVYQDLIARRPDVNFGLLLYSTENYIARYFSYKNELFADSAENREEIFDISTGTRTAEALRKARKFLVDNTDPQADKAIVLISDLESDLSAMVEMVEEMQIEVLAGFRVYLIIVGDGRQGVAFVNSRLPSAKGLTIVDMKDKVGIDQVCTDMAGMALSPIREEESTTKNSLIPFFMVPTLGLFAFTLVLSEIRFLKIP